MFAAVVLLALVSPVSTTRLTGMVNYRGRVVPVHATSAERGHHWEVVSETVQHDIMHHFGVRVASGVTCEIFYVAGMPAAALCWTTTNTKGHPAVTSVHLDKSLLMLYDAGDAMRYTLWQRYPSISFHADVSFEDFYTI